MSRRPRRLCPRCLGLRAVRKDGHLHRHRCDPPGSRPPLSRRRHPQMARGIRLLQDGVPPKEVAPRLGVGLSTVYVWRRELGLPRQPAPRHPRRAEGEALLRQGVSARHVAARIGVSPWAVCLWRRELGLPSPITPRRPPPPRPPRPRRRVPCSSPSAPSRG